MASQEPPAWLAAAVGAPEQLRRPLFLDAPGPGQDDRAPPPRRRGAFELLLGAAAARRHLAGSVPLLGAAASRRAPAQLGGAPVSMSMLQRRALADEDAIVAVHHLAPAAEGSSEEVTGLATALLPLEVGGSFSKEDERARGLKLTPHCVAAQTHSARKRRKEEMASQEPALWLAAAVGATDQPRRPLFLDAAGRDERAPPPRRRHLAGAVVLLGAAATRRAPVQLGGAPVSMSMLQRRALLADKEEEQVDGVVAEHALVPAAEHSSEEMAEAATALLDADVIPIFVGKLTLTVSLNQSSQQLMQVYARRMKMKLDDQYFVYGGKKLEPNHSLNFYGLERNCTVHVCTRLLGGKPPTLGDYVRDNKNTFTVEVTLPDGEVSLQMTMRGCQFLSSWTNCFTAAFARGESWCGEFTLEDFKYVDGHIRNIKWPKPKDKCPPGSMAKDLMKFANQVERILHYDRPNLISKHPPYLAHFTRSLQNIGSKTLSNVLSSEHKLFLETHVCCMTSSARERLIIELFRKYEGIDANEASDWKTALETASCSKDWVTELPAKKSFFGYVIKKGEKKGVEYKGSRSSAFKFIKDIVLHTTDYDIENLDVQQYGDGTELMIPAHLDDFLPSIILSLIEKKVDISAELLAAIRCACRVCDSSQ